MGSTKETDLDFWLVILSRPLLGVTMTTIFPIQDNEHSIAWTLTLTAQACAQWCSRQRCGDRRYGRDLPTGIVQISPGGAMHASHAVFHGYLATRLGFDNLLPASSRCQEVGPIVLLNFASAKNPGEAKRYKFWGVFFFGWESAAREV